MTAQSARRAWLVLLGCFLVSMGYMAYSIAPASILPIVVDRFAIDKAAAGSSISVIYLAWFLLQLPGGWVMDRYDNRWLIGLAVVVFVFAALGSAVARGFAGFLGTRFIAGACAVFIWTASTNVVSRSFPASKRAFGTSVFVTSAPAGVAIAQFGGPPIAAAFGWRAVLLIYPAIALLGVPLLAIALRSPIRNETRLSLVEFGGTLKQRPILLLSVSSFCAYSLFLFFNSWMPTYAAEAISIDLAAAGAASALVPLAGLIARPGGGWLADRIGGYRPVILSGFLLAIPVLVGLGLVTRFRTFAGLLLLAGIASQLAIGVFYVYAVELAADAASGTSLALLTTVSVLGSLTAPVAGGWLVDVYSWGTAFVAAGGIAVLGMVAALMVPDAG